MWPWCNGITPVIEEEVEFVNRDDSILNAFLDFWGSQDYDAMIRTEEFSFRLSSTCPKMETEGSTDKMKAVFMEKDSSEKSDKSLFSFLRKFWIWARWLE